MNRSPENYINAQPDTIYFVKPVGMDGPYKIGCSSDVKRRVRHLSNGSPFELELVCTLAGDKFLEAKIHARLLTSHLRCEWFDGCDDVREVVRQIKAGELDEAELPEGVSVWLLKGGKNAKQLREGL